MSIDEAREKGAIIQKIVDAFEDPVSPVNMHEEVMLKVISTYRIHSHNSTHIFQIEIDGILLDADDARKYFNKCFAVDAELDQWKELPVYSFEMTASKQKNGDRGIMQLVRRTSRDERVSRDMGEYIKEAEPDCRVNEGLYSPIQETQ